MMNYQRILLLLLLLTVSVGIIFLSKAAEGNLFTFSGILGLKNKEKRSDDITWITNLLEEAESDLESQPSLSFNSCENIFYLKAWTDSYFTDVAKYDGIVTKIVKIPFADITNYVIDKYYKTTSNDCELLSKHISRERVRLLSYCGNTFQEAVEAFNIDIKAFEVGLQNNYTDVVDANKQVTTGYIHIMKNAIASTYGNVLTQNIHVSPQRCKQNRGTKCQHKFNYTAIPIFDDVFTISQFWGHGFYHNTIEELPRLAPYVDFLLKYPHVKIHSNKASPFLDVLGLNKSRIISGAVRAKHLFMPAGTQCGFPTLFNIQILSKSLKSKYYYEPRNIVVLVKRKHHRNRWFAYHDAILGMLQLTVGNVNLTVEVFSDDPLPSIARTAELFNRAVLVVAPHGAGLSNLIFSRPGTVVMEGLCHLVNLCYRHLVYVLGMRHYGYLPKGSCKHITPEQLERPVSDFTSLYSQGVLP